jgi:uncharacterized protein (DUF58 family)
MWNKKTGMYFSFALTPIILGLILRDPQFLVMGIIFSMLMLTVFFTSQSKVEVERIIPNPKVFENDEMEVILRIKCLSRSLGTLEIYDTIPSSMKLVKGSNKILANLNKNEEVELRYSVTCPLRGYYNFGPVLIRNSDFFNLFLEKRSIVDKTTIVVYPRMLDVRKVPIDSKFRKLHPGSITMRHVGSGSDFHSIRDYIPSDPFRVINWKVSARLRKLMVNQYETEDVFDTIILIDARRKTAVGSQLYNPLEYSVRAGLTLSEHIMKRSNRVGLLTYGDTVKIIPPGNGDTQMAQILALLTETYAGGKTSMRFAYERMVPFLTPRSPIILISPLNGDNTIHYVVRELCGKGHEVTIISPSPIEFERFTTRTYSSKYMMVKMERENELATLNSFGATVIDWTLDKSFANVCAEVAL